MRISDQFLSREEAAALRDDHRKQADEWLSRLITSMMAGCGVGLVVLATYFASKTVDNIAIQIGGAVAALFLLVALYILSRTMVFMQHAAALRAQAYESIVDEKNFAQNVASELPKDEASGFRSGYATQVASANQVADNANKMSGRSLYAAILCLQAGVWTTFITIMFNSVNLEPVRKFLLSLI